MDSPSDVLAMILSSCPYLPRSLVGNQDTTARPEAAVDEGWTSQEWEGSTAVQEGS